MDKTVKRLECLRVQHEQSLAVRDWATCDKIRAEMDRVLPLMFTDYDDSGRVIVLHYNASVEVANA